MSDLTFGVKLEGNSSKLVSETRAARDEFVALQKQTDALSASNAKMASGYSGLDAAVKQHTAAVKETEGGVNKLLDRYDPLGAKLRQLQADFKALDAAAAGGKIAGRDDARVDQVYARLQAEINATTAAASNMGVVASGAMNKTTLSAGQLRMATQQLPMQFTDIWVSLAAGQSPMMVMLQQGTQIKDSFGGAGSAAKALGGYILGLMNPITLITAAVAAGGYAWYQWASDAESAADRTVAATDRIIASMRSTDAVYVLQRERDQLAKKIPVQWLSYDDNQLSKLSDDAQKLIAEYKNIDKQLKSEVGRSTREWENLHATDAERKTAALKNEQQLYDEQVVLAKGNSDKLIALQQQHHQKVAAINKSFEKKSTGRGDDRTESEKAFADAWVETQKLIQNTDPQEKAKAEWQNMLYLKQTLGDQFPLTAEQMEQAYAKSVGGMVDKTDKSTGKMSETWKTFADNTQRTLSDVLYNGMNGQFNNIEEMFKQMLFRMAANAAAANITKGLFGDPGTGSSGLLGSMMKAFGFAKGGAFDGAYAFADGGAFTNGLYTSPTPFKFASGGGFNLGVMGEAGPEAVMPLARDSSGKLGVRSQGGGGQPSIVLHDHTTIHVDSRSDRSQVLADISRLMDAKQNQLVDRLRRDGALA